MIWGGGSGKSGKIKLNCYSRGKKNSTQQPGRKKNQQQVGQEKKTQQSVGQEKNLNANFLPEFSVPYTFYPIVHVVYENILCSFWHHIYKVFLNSEKSIFRYLCMDIMIWVPCCWPLMGQVMNIMSYSQECKIWEETRGNGSFSFII